MSDRKSQRGGVGLPLSTTELAELRLLDG